MLLPQYLCIKQFHLQIKLIEIRAGHETLMPWTTCKHLSTTFLRSMYPKLSNPKLIKITEFQTLKLHSCWQSVPLCNEITLWNHSHSTTTPPSATHSVHRHPTKSSNCKFATCPHSAQVSCTWKAKLSCLLKQKPAWQQQKQQTSWKLDKA